MKLYEVNEAIMDALDRLEEQVDTETGEVIGDDVIATDIMAELNALGMERERILSYLAKCVLNERADIDAIRSEEMRLAALRKKREVRCERLMKILDRECAGQKTDLGIAVVSYRKSESIEVINQSKAVEWLHANGHNDCVRIPTPQVAKDMVKKLIKNDAVVPGVKLVTKNNCSLR